jgi:hypothetical protein
MSCLIAESQDNGYIQCKYDKIQPPENDTNK